MILRSLTNGVITGTNTLSCPSRIVGAIAVSADSTNAAVISIRRDDASGKQIFAMSSIHPLFVGGPIATEGTDQIYVSVSGTGASAQIYEWVE
jgi:hypothetical protein